MFDLNGKLAIVAGGSGLLGKAIVEHLRESGARVGTIDPKPRTRSVDHLPLDISDIGSWSEVNAAWGDRIEIFVNASYPSDPRDHLNGYLLATSIVAEIMVGNEKGGSIINLASVYGVMAPDYRIYNGTAMTMPPEYAAVKGGIIAHSRLVAARYARYGVRVNCVSPGGVYDGQDQRFVDAYSDRVPMGRMANPEDITPLIVYLASDESRYVTGQNWLVDGGMGAW